MLRQDNNETNQQRSFFGPAASLVGNFLSVDFGLLGSLLSSAPTPNRKLLKPELVSLGDDLGASPQLVLNILLEQGGQTVGRTTRKTILGVETIIMPLVPRRLQNPEGPRNLVLASLVWHSPRMPLTAASSKNLRLDLSQFSEWSQKRNKMLAKTATPQMEVGSRPEKLTKPQPADRKVQLRMRDIELVLTAMEMAVNVETAGKVKDSNDRFCHVLQACWDYVDFRFSRGLDFLNACRLIQLKEVVDAIDTRMVKAFCDGIDAPEQAVVIPSESSFFDFATRISAKLVNRIEEEVAL